MTAPAATLSASDTVESVFKRFEILPEPFHAYPVTDVDGRMISICTFNDLKRALSAGKAADSLQEIATKEIETISPDQTLDTALLKMGRTGISQLPVVDIDNRA